MFFVPEWMGDVCTRTWSNMATADSAFWKSVSHNGTIWVATGSSGATNINYSSDGSTWSSATGGSQLSDNYARERVCWNGTTWAVLAIYDLNPGHGMTSTDGQAWTNRNVAYIASNVARQLSVMGTTFIATSHAITDEFYISTDGYSFGASGGGLPYTTAWGASAYNGSTLVMLTSGNSGNDDRTAYSLNQGAVWQAGGALPVASSWSDLIWTGRVFFALDFNSPANAARSYDGGVTWTAVTMPAPSGIQNWGQPCANAKGTIFIPMWYKSGFNTHTVLYASVDDGDTWCLNTLSQSGQWGCAGSDGSRVVVCGNNIGGAVDGKGSYADPS